MSRRSQSQALTSFQGDPIPDRNKSFCAHGMQCEFNALTSWGTNVASNLYKCRGTTKHGCTSFMLQKCWMASHRCGVGECKCNCKECIESSITVTKVKSNRHTQMDKETEPIIVEELKSSNDSELNYWASDNESSRNELSIPSQNIAETSTVILIPSRGDLDLKQNLEGKEENSSILPENPNSFVKNAQILVTDLNTTVSEDVANKKCYYSCEKYDITNDEEIMGRIHKQFECDSSLLCVKYGSHPIHRENKLIKIDTSAAVYNLTHDDLVVIIWDDLHSSRVVETVDQAKMEEMCNAGILRTVQFDVSSTCQSATSRAEEVTSHLDNQEEEIAGNGSEDVMVTAQTVDLSGNDSDHEVEVLMNVNTEILNNDINEGNSINEVDDDSEGFVPNEDIIDDNELSLSGSLEDRFLKDYRNSSVKADATKFRVSVYSKFILDKNTPESWYIIPEPIYENEIQLHNQLLELNDISKNMENLKLRIGGRDRTFWTFHYPPENSYPSNDRRGIWEFIELNELQLLYRYDIKAVMSFNCQDRGFGGNGRRKILRPRLFMSYFYLVCNECEKFTPKRFVLVSILTTLCVAPFNVYVIWDNLLETMIEWQGENIIKYFWCDFNSKVDHKLYRDRLDYHFRRRCYYYDKKRTIPRDYHNIGNMDHKFDTSPEIASQRLEYWNLSAGLRKVDNSIVAKREIKPVQQYVGYATGLEIVGSAKKRGPTVSKQQLAALNAKNKRQKLLLEKLTRENKRKELEDSELTNPIVNKKLRSGTSIESDEIIGRVESYMDAIKNDNSQLAGQMVKIAAKVETAISNQSINQKINELTIKTSSALQPSPPHIDEFQKQMFEHLKTKDLSASNKDEFLIKQFVSNQDKQLMADRSLISLRMWLCCAGFTVLVIFVCLCLGYISMVVSKAVDGNIKLTVTV